MIGLQIYMWEILSYKNAVFLMIFHDYSIILKCLIYIFY